MNAAQLERPRWTRRKWCYVIGTVLVGQMLLIAILGQRGIATPTPMSFAMDIRIAPKAGARGPSLPDPAVFALPNWNGFSREGWLAFEHPEFKPMEWTEQPQWLPLQTAELGNSLNDFILSNTIAPLLVANMAAPSSPVPQAPRVEAPLKTASEVAIEGELTAWRLLNPVTLPSWRHTDLLTNTVVHAVVNRLGQTVVTALIAGSGLAEADDYALGLVKEARFAPKPGRASVAEYTSGNVVFDWHTQAPTNAAVLIPLPVP